MRASVIGSNGYIGKHLCKFLHENKWDVFMYDIHDQPILPNIPYEKIDVRHRTDLEKIEVQVEYIFFLAGLTGTVKAFDDYSNYIQSNEIGLLHLLDHIRKSHGRARLIFPSTRLVYKGIPNTPLTEESEKECKTIYAINKLSCELYIKSFADTFGVDYTIFRICVPYGNLFDNGYSYGTIGFFLTQANAGNDISIFGDGKQKRTFTHIYDICSSIVLALHKKESKNQIYNIGGETFSILEIADYIANQHHVSIKHLEWPPIDLALESGDTIFDATKLNNLLNYHLKYNFVPWLTNQK